MNKKELLAGLPLFLGMTDSDLESAAAMVQIVTRRYGRQRVVATDGERCGSLCFLCEGQLAATSFSLDRGYSIVETLSAPDMLQPERLFGLSQLFTKTFTALTPCTILAISKGDTARLVERFIIFRLNILNILSTQAQKANRPLWRSRPNGTRRRITHFIESHCSYPAGRKTVNITMQRLADEVHESRLNVSRQLNAMHSEGLITLRRSEIVVPALERLLARQD